MAKHIILIKPIVTEKAALLSTKENTYVFKVAKTANKIEIGKAIEAKYGIEPKRVNTLIVPGKTKSRMRGGAVVRGGTASYKKAYVTFPAGESIDFYNAADATEGGE